MDNTKNVLWSTFAVVACLAAGAGGYLLRASSDMGSASNLSTLLASAEPGAQISESQYFYELTQLLRHQYVDPIEVDQSLSSGAVRGMVNSLLDPDTIFLNPDQNKAYIAGKKGEIEGIGVEVRYVFNEEELQKLRDGEANRDALMLLPEVVITSVFPDSPAEKAGLKPGDVVQKVNDKFIVTHKDVARFRELQNLVTEEKAPQSDLDEYRKTLDEKIKNNIPTNRARELLVTGSSGTVTVAWTSEGQTRTQTVPLQHASYPSVEKLSDGTYKVRFFEGVGESLTKANLKDGDTLDLRNGPLGSVQALLEALQVITPAGTYGTVHNERTSRPTQVVTRKGVSDPIKLSLLVDHSTTGVAAVFAQALQAKGYATLQGELPSKPPKWVVHENLPDGAGYTLMTGVYRPDAKTGEAQ